LLRPGPSCRCSPAGNVLRPEGPPRVSILRRPHGYKGRPDALRPRRQASPGSLRTLLLHQDAARLTACRDSQRTASITRRRIERKEARFGSRSTRPRPQQSSRFVPSLVLLLPSRGSREARLGAQRRAGLSVHQRHEGAPTAHGPHLDARSRRRGTACRRSPRGVMRPLACAPNILAGAATAGDFRRRRLPGRTPAL
jgi:hypothetical protein